MAITMTSAASVAAQPTPERRPPLPAASGDAKAAAPSSDANAAHVVLSAAASAASSAAEATETPATTAREAANGDKQAIRIETKLHAAHKGAPRAGHKIHVVM